MIEHLRECGIPDSAMTFLKDHTTIDQGHNRLMEKYAAHLLTSKADVDCVVNSMRTTGFLYASMMEAAIQDAATPVDPRLELGRTACGWRRPCSVEAASCVGDV